MFKPTAILRYVDLIENRSSLIQNLEGHCVMHQGRPDLVGRPIYTSSIIKKHSHNLFETRNTMYHIESWAEVVTYEPKTKSNKNLYADKSQ